MKFGCKFGRAGINNKARNFDCLGLLKKSNYCTSMFLQRRRNYQLNSIKALT
ncbi:hypothetical protein M5D96_004108, partial [Drosophila gunungcola]